MPQSSRLCSEKLFTSDWLKRLSNESFINSNNALHHRKEQQQIDLEGKTMEKQLLQNPVEGSMLTAVGIMFRMFTAVDANVAAAAANVAVHFHI